MNKYYFSIFKKKNTTINHLLNILTLVQKVSDVECEGRQNGIKHLKLFTEAWHKQKKTGWSLFIESGDRKRIIQHLFQEQI